MKKNARNNSKNIAFTLSALLVVAVLASAERANAIDFGLGLNIGNFSLGVGVNDRNSYGGGYVSAGSAPVVRGQAPSYGPAPNRGPAPNYGPAPNRGSYRPGPSYGPAPHGGPAPRAVYGGPRY